MSNKLLLFILISTITLACKSDDKPLPYIGETQVIDSRTQYHTISDWKYTNQNGETVTNKDLSEYIYIADFFFTSCPSICPKVMKQMLRLQKEFADEPRVRLVSFTMDPKRDTEEKLTAYANAIGADLDKWIFLRGDKEATFDLANEYFIVAYEDADVPGGFDHSGKIILIDKAGHVRSFSEGTDPSETPKLIKDTKKLLKSYGEN